MLPQEIIRRKRDGETLTAAKIRFFASGLGDGSVGEGQMAAFAMAVYFQGMTRKECVALTLAMRDSGEVLDWGTLDLDGPVLNGVIPDRSRATQMLTMPVREQLIVELYSK